MIKIRHRVTGTVLREIPVSSPEELVLRWSILPGAALAGVRWPHVDLRDSYLRGACLHGANLKGACLRRADLRDTDLQEADLRGADLRGADLEGADLCGAVLDGAAYDESTRWPPGFDPRARRARDLSRRFWQRGVHPRP